MKLQNNSAVVLFSLAILTGCATTAPSGSQNGTPTATISDDDIKAGFRMKDTDRGTMITFNDRLLFNTGKAELTNGAATIIEKIATISKEKDIQKIEINGHTDNQGTMQYNQTLSEERAAAVRTALIAKGLRGERLKATGFGLSKPEATNDTPAGRAMNRRAEILMVNVSKKSLGGEKVEQGLANSAANAIANMVDGVKKKFSEILDAFK